MAQERAPLGGVSPGGRGQQPSGPDKGSSAVQLHHHHHHRGLAARRRPGSGGSRAEGREGGWKGGRSLMAGDYTGHCFLHGEETWILKDVFNTEKSVKRPC